MKATFQCTAGPDDRLEVTSDEGDVVVLKVVYPDTIQHVVLEVGQVEELCKVLLDMLEEIDDG